MSYNYKEGKNRIVEILNNKLEVKNIDKLPSDDNFTFENSYYSWVTAVFVDIRDSSKIFDLDNKENTSKILRSFTSEIIEILRDSNLFREIGIRGDCVYAIYTTPTQDVIYDCYLKAAYINTLLNMLNKLFDDYGFSNIKAGIGIATSKELVIKAGRKDVGINSKVWIGSAVTKASNLSSLGEKLGNSRIILSDTAYDNIVDYHEEKFDSINITSWFTRKNHEDYGSYYHGDVIITDFDDWVNEGMPND